MSSLALPWLKPLTRPLDRATEWQRQRRYWRLVQEIKRQGESFRELDAADLRRASFALRFRAKAREPLDELLVEAYALVREAARRSLGMEHFDVQLFAGIALHDGSVVQMQTGEGKTLTAALPMYLAGLEGQGAHLATANDYLAERDAHLLRPLYEMLGYQVGVVQSENTRQERAAAYACDVTYGTAKEFGFDFLRDRLRQRDAADEVSPTLKLWLEQGRAGGSPHRVQRGFHFAIVDEADSVMLDEARTPLVVSAAPAGVLERDRAACRWAAEHAAAFVVDTHFEWQGQGRSLTLTSAGRQQVRQLPHPPELDTLGLQELYLRVERAILAEHRFQRNQHYVLRDDEIVIVDEHTGRLAEGRKWRDGIHQAIEAKEGLTPSAETGQAARLTLQSLLRRYSQLAGMTGTLGHARDEFRTIYELQGVTVPTHRPPLRQELPARVYWTQHEKWRAIVEEIQLLRLSRRPVLVGTRTIEHSLQLSQVLREQEVPHEVLNATQLEREAAIVSEAGQAGRVTVATNMAGRGTDIKIDDAVRQAGGLHVIGSELHESARIDRQLIGRCGRQGDPGSYRQYFSLEDELVENAYGRRRAEAWRQRLQKKRKQEDRCLPPPLARIWIERCERAQAKLEREHFRVRQQLLRHEQDRFEQHQQLGEDPYLDAPE